VNSRVRYLGVLVGLGVALILPQIVYPVLAFNILLYGLFAVSVDLLLGFLGLMSFGHAAFWGSAGYAAAILAHNYQTPFPVAVAFGLAVALLLALPIGYLSIRLKGIYFAMVTLAFAEMVFYIVNQWRDVTGGETGLTGVPRLLPGVDLTSPAAYYYAALPFVLAALWLTHRIVHSPFGHVLISIRDNEARTQALGYPTHRYKWLAFILSAGLAGLAGSLFSVGHGFATLDLVSSTTSANGVLMVILGGVGTLWGGYVGAAVVLWLRDTLATLGLVGGGELEALKKAPDVVTGIIFVVAVLGFRRGLWVGLRELPVSLGRRGKDRREQAQELVTTK
jgi:branched-chain amino acid transport system permease protein